MQPESIPFILCGVFCLLPILAGLLGYFIPRILANRLPILSTSRFIKQGRKYIVNELSFLTKDEIRSIHKAARLDK